MEEETDCKVSLEREHVWRIDQVERRKDVLLLKKTCCLCNENMVESQVDTDYVACPEKDSGMTFFGAVGIVLFELPIALFFYVIILAEKAFGRRE